jgi:hypothetical protein
MHRVYGLVDHEADSVHGSLMDHTRGGAGASPELRLAAGSRHDFLP